VTATEKGVVDRGGGDTPDLVVETRDVTKHFPMRANGLFARSPGLVRAVDGVSVSVRAGQTLGVVGESGCGKSTLARLCAGGCRWCSRIRLRRCRRACASVR